MFLPLVHWPNSRVRLDPSLWIGPAPYRRSSVHEWHLQASTPYLLTVVLTPSCGCVVLYRVVLRRVVLSCHCHYLIHIRHSPTPSPSFTSSSSSFTSAFHLCLPPLSHPLITSLTPLSHPSHPSISPPLSHPSISPPLSHPSISQGQLRECSRPFRRSVRKSFPRRCEWAHHCHIDKDFNFNLLLTTLKVSYWYECYTLYFIYLLFIILMWYDINCFVVT